MKLLRLLTGLLMLAGLVGGFNQCNSITDAAESNIHEIYAVAVGTALVRLCLHSRQSYREYWQSDCWLD